MWPRTSRWVARSHPTSLQGPRRRGGAGPQRHRTSRKRESEGTRRSLGGLGGAGPAPPGLPPRTERAANCGALAEAAGAAAGALEASRGRSRSACVLSSDPPESARERRMGQARSRLHGTGGPVTLPRVPRRPAGPLHRGAHGAQCPGARLTVCESGPKAPCQGAFLTSPTQETPAPSPIVPRGCHNYHPSLGRAWSPSRACRACRMQRRAAGLQAWAAWPPHPPLPGSTHKTRAATSAVSSH